MESPSYRPPSSSAFSVALPDTCELLTLTYCPIIANESGLFSTPSSQRSSLQWIVLQCLANSKASSCSALPWVISVSPPPHFPLHLH